MSIKAIILLLTLTSFVSETSLLPLQLNSKTAKSSSLQKTNTNHCSRNKKKQPKPEKKCCDDAVCTFCPSTTAFVPLYELTDNIPSIAIIKKYQPACTGKLSAYQADVWRPPNDHLRYR